ncbi:hypothetical protein E3W66_08385 [Gammaproteobacteria bacterium LSUCC0057]|uniref:Cadherin domain-containing protein n=1 Tax=Gammaproteobacteria bacterium LSUCC0057 TaxID=2559237 RepID=A0A4Y8UF84_9GAMM|nr:hypothetical protein E3W66_08385 [Gammaproteobacteria bacterium LSUCC0057]
MAGYILISLGSDGAEQRQAIDPRYLLVVEAQPGLRYRVVSSESGDEPGLQRLHRREGDLLIEGDGDALVRIIGFFSEPLAVTYQATESVDIDASDLGSEPSGDGVVWDAVDGGGVCLFAAAAAVGAAASSSGGSAGAGGGSAGASSSTSMVSNIATAVANNAVVAVGVGAAAAAGVVAATAQEDDPELAELQITPLAGPFTVSAQVAVYGADGERLTDSAIEHDFSQGPFTLILAEGYVGPVLIVISDSNDYEPDFVDEATGEPRNLGTELRALVEVNDASTLHVSVTPLTELAVRIAGVEAGQPLAGELLQANTRIGEIFGIDDITAQAIDIFDEAFDESDGVSAAESYGRLLAAISGVQPYGDLAYAIDEIALYLEGDINGLEVDADLFRVLRDAAEFFEQGPNRDRAEVLPVVSPVAPRIAEFQLDSLADGGVINRDFLVDGVAIDVDLPVGSQIGHSAVLQWGRQRIEYELDDEHIADGYVRFTVGPEQLIAQGSGELEVAASFNGELLTLSTRLEVDITQPVLAGNVQVSYDERSETLETLAVVQQSSSDTAQSLTAFKFVASDSNVSSDGYFQIDNFGQITLTAAGSGDNAASNDYETGVNSFNHQVVAQDINGNWSQPITVNLAVNNIDDAAPQLRSVNFVNGTTLGTTPTLLLNFDEEIRLGSDSYVKLTGSSQTLTLYADATTHGAVSVAGEQLTVALTTPLIDFGENYQVEFGGTLILDASPLANNWAGLEGENALNFTLARPVALFNLGSQDVTFQDQLIKPGQSSSFNGGRTFSDDFSFEIVVLVESDDNTWTPLQAGQQWSGVANLGSDDKIIIASRDGGAISATAMAPGSLPNSVAAAFSAGAVEFTYQSGAYTHFARLEVDGQFYLFAGHENDGYHYHNRGGTALDETATKYPITLWSGSLGSNIAAPSVLLSAGWFLTI